jgi:hypothetical protein
VTKGHFLESAMQTPDLDTYLRLAVHALPDTANTAERLSGVMTVLQTARAALRDDQPDTVGPCRCGADFGPMRAQADERRVRQGCAVG